MRVACLAIVALLLSGCAEDAPTETTTGSTTSLTSSLSVQDEVPLNFASGDYEALASFEATFTGTDSCFPQCSGTARQVIDLTPYVPAEAPVELTVNIQHDGSVESTLIFEEATPIRQDREGGGQGGGGATQLSALMVRNSAGTVELRLTHRINPGSPNGVTATIEVRSVVRADVLVPGIPAAVNLPPGSILNFTNDELEQAVLITGDGTVVRDLDTPFSLQVPNGTGDSIVMVLGGDTKVLGPNVTMEARRVVEEMTPPKDLAAGETTLQLDAPKAPLLLGVVISSKNSGVPFLDGPSVLGPFQVTVTSPANVAVLEEDCQGGGGGGFPLCGAALAFGGDDAYFQTAFLDEYLVPGAYTVSITTQQVNGYEAFAYQVQIIE